MPHPNGEIRVLQGEASTLPFLSHERGEGSRDSMPAGARSTADLGFLFG